MPFIALVVMVVLVVVVVIVVLAVVVVMVVLVAVVVFVVLVDLYGFVIKMRRSYSYYLKTAWLGLYFQQLSNMQLLQ